MYKIIFFFLLTIMVSMIALAQQTAAPTTSTADSKARAQEVLKQAQAAIWGDTKSKPLQSISITASSHRMLMNNEIPIDITVDAILPDKFLQTLSPNLSNFGGMTVGLDMAFIYAFNGSQSWSDLKSSNPELINRFGGNRLAGMLGGAQAGQVNVDTYLQAEFARLLMVWFLTTPTSLPVEYTYAGEAKADGKTADVLDAKGTNNFAARLFIDQQTHQILMLTTQTPNLNLYLGAQAPGQGNRPADGNRNAAGNQGNQNNQGNRPANPPTPEEQEKMRAEREKRMKERQEALAKAPLVETRWVLTDYRKANGITLPYHLAKSTQGQISEEINIQKVKVNPALKPDKFEKKEEKKK